MPRKARVAPGGLAYHVLNRGNRGMPLFRKELDYLAFEKVMREAMRRTPTRLLAWCLMPNHWHLVIWPRREGELTEFVRWLTHTHVQRWHAHRHSFGSGHVYQGRFKSFPIEQDEHFLTVCRYVERNALRADLAQRAEEWRWGSLWIRERGSQEQRALLSEWPVHRPSDWTQFVNRPHTSAELASVRDSLRRGSPYGGEKWRQRTAEQLDLQWTLRPRGRPRVRPVGEKK